jgi:NADH-quinone oxidoreductase subunit M
MVVVSSLGVILSAAYLLWMVKRVLYGEVTNEKNRALPDLSGREAAIILPLCALAILMGVASPFFTRKMEPALDNLIQNVRRSTQPVPPTVTRAGTPPAPLAEVSR